ncbi:hypothetical protein FHX81_3927 [Saccharothrix saharensis]|uniref:Peptidase inhibitor family I36 n=1 Tax=Saccharothrix saharensis TaxID=571190 RepID=A0A543JFG2_9PSEU|nr:hypothetical protein [Saccharothrix saharensis]TQM81560.1 hypothetical protein FHX81_3927 [Saccharothrix saharensis]
MRRAAAAVGLLGAGILSALVLAPSAQADPKTCDSGEVCLYTYDALATYTTAGNVDNYVNAYWTDRGDAIVHRFTSLNDKAATAVNNGCQCGPSVVALYRDSFGGGGVIAKVGIGGRATAPTGSDAGASSHSWVWS